MRHEVKVYLILSVFVHLRVCVWPIRVCLQSFIFTATKGRGMKEIIANNGGSVGDKGNYTKKNAMQFYEIASLCANVPLLSTLLQFSTKKTLQEGLDWGQP